MAYRLLLIDDDQLFLQALVAFLDTDDRFEVVGTAENGIEGVKRAAALRPDVVLMDIDMPLMDGVEASRRIHEDQPVLPIVLVSASQYADRVDQAHEAGATGYVQKGRVDTELVETILAVASEDRRKEAAERLRASLGEDPAGSE